MSTLEINALAIAAQAGVPIMAIGSPGIGKSAVIRAIAKTLNWPCEIVLTAIREPTDFGGFPVDTPDGLVLKAPAWARRLQRARTGLLFLDELNQAPPAVQAAVMRVILDGVVGDEEMGPGIARIAAVNPPEEGASAFNLAAPLANRLCHLPFPVNADAWCDGMVAGWPAPAIPRLPDDWEADGRLFSSNSLVAAFIRSRRTLLFQIPKSESQMAGAWPSPRSWTMAARLHCATLAASGSEELVMKLVAGCVGDGAAMEFFTWMKALDLPDPEKLLDKPDSLDIKGKRGDIVYATLGSVTSVVLGRNTDKRWRQGWKVLARAIDTHPDIAAVSAKALAQNQPAQRGAAEPEEVMKFQKILQAAGLLGKK